VGGPGRKGGWVFKIGRKSEFRKGESLEKFPVLLLWTKRKKKEKGTPKEFNSGTKINRIKKNTILAGLKRVKSKRGRHGEGTLWTQVNRNFIKSEGEGRDVTEGGPSKHHVSETGVIQGEIPDILQGRSWSQNIKGRDERLRIGSGQKRSQPLNKRVRVEGDKRPITRKDRDENR